MKSLKKMVQNSISVYNFHFPERSPLSRVSSFLPLSQVKAFIFHIGILNFQFSIPLLLHSAFYRLSDRLPPSPVTPPSVVVGGGGEV